MPLRRDYVGFGLLLNAKGIQIPEIPGAKKE